ncbi:Mitochondrial import inner membrane translocase subunit Tim8 B [Mactra antiquata]
MNFDSKPSGGSEKTLDPKVAQFAQEKQFEQQLIEQVEKISSKCWEMCNVSMKDRLDSKQETCIRNCTGRYFDVSELIADRYAKRLQQAASSGSFS